MLAVPCPVQEIARRDPGLEAIRTPADTISYGELDARANYAAARLRAVGCGAGDRVGLLMPNGEDYLILLLALWRIGCVACPISTRLPGEAVADALAGVSARLLVAEGEQRDAEDKGIRVVMPGNLSPGNLEKEVQGADANHPQPLLEKEGSFSSSGVSRIPQLDLELDRSVVAVFTSGSTGRPKAALLSWGNLYYNALGSNRNIPLGPGDRWLLSLPLYHVGGLG
ncbi:MAG TPA: class I adenylate-forming enzyme family protein, partial [Rhodothermales bacterium]|nr:class I adenylate-forming enzyme family protein [Rhodothermales bacterium]